MHQGDHIIMLFSMQFLGLPASAAPGGSGNENGQARAKPGRQRRKVAREAAGRPLVAQAGPPRAREWHGQNRLPQRRQLAPLQGTILPTRAEREGFAPAQDARMKEWRTRNAPTLQINTTGPA